MTSNMDIVKYFRGCVSEEVKNSAFTNLNSDNSMRVPLHKGSRLAENFPTPTEFPESSKELLELMLTSAVDTRKELIYATAFVRKTINGKSVNAPLLYCPCEITRDKQGVAVHLLSEVWHVNAGILALIEDKQEEEVKLLMQHLPLVNADCTELAKWFQEFEQYFEAGLAPQMKYEVISLTMPKASAGMLNDLDKIANASDTLNSSLVVLSEEVRQPAKDLNAPLAYINNLSDSQIKALETCCNSTVTAIIGAPGTGKSNTIVGIATHLIANGHSVLIASKMNEAVNVVRDRLLIPKNGKLPFAVRTGSKEYRKELADLLDAIVDGKYSEYTESLDSCYGSYTKEDLEKQYKRMSTLRNAEEEVAYYSGLVEGLKARKREFTKDYLISRFDLISAEHKLKNAQRRAEDSSPYDQVYLDVYRLSVFSNQIVENVKNLTTQTARRELIMMSRMLKSGKLTPEYDNFFKALVYRGLPCWLTTINAVSESIPCIAGLFDYVIIDEASQCDIGSCIPLLYRAKRAIIVGDNKQLKYLSFMSKDKNLCYAKNFGLTDEDLVKLDYTKNSMFDFAQYYADRQPVMLKEHFRSSSDIFGFSNEKFYNGRIKCVSDTNGTYQHIFQCDVAHTANNWISTPEGGHTIVEQDSKYTRNFYEAKEVVKTVKALIATTAEKNLNAHSSPLSIGILSPFRAQVDLIQDMINHEISLEDRQEHKILVGTAHAFQGNERDVMLNSWTVAKNSRRQSFTFINNPNLFNVSITRASYRVINFFSMESLADLPDGLLKEYLTYCARFIKSNG